MSAILVFVGLVGVALFAATFFSWKSSEAEHFEDCERMRRILEATHDKSKDS